MKKILIRAASGSIYVALIVAALLLQWPYMFICLFALFIVLGVIELHKLVDNDMAPSHRRTVIALDCIGGIIMFLLFSCLGLEAVNCITGLLLSGYLAYLAARMIMQLYVKNENA